MQSFVLSVCDGPTQTLSHTRLTIQEAATRNKANPMSTTFTSDDDPIIEISNLINNCEMVRRSSMRLSLRRVSVRESLAANKALSTNNEAANDTVTPTSTQSAESIDKAYDKTSLRGAPNGLFRSCMGAIKSSHTFQF